MSDWNETQVCGEPEQVPGERNKVRRTGTSEPRPIDAQTQGTQETLEGQGETGADMWHPQIIIKCCSYNLLTLYSCLNICDSLVKYIRI